MDDPAKLRRLAQKCRERAQSSTDLASIEQLRHWAVELADAADLAEWNEHDPGDPDMARALLSPEGEST
jgi:hypothetical protein